MRINILFVTLFLVSNFVTFLNLFQIYKSSKLICIRKILKINYDNQNMLCFTLKNFIE